jgi:hypothetical protein
MYLLISETLSTIEIEGEGEGEGVGHPLPHFTFKK